MTDNVSDDLIYAVLQKMQGQLAGVTLRLGDLKGRLAGREEATASMSARIVSVGISMAGVQKRMGRFEHRLDRIETRLGLIDA